MAADISGEGARRRWWQPGRGPAATSAAMAAGSVRVSTPTTVRILWRRCLHGYFRRPPREGAHPRRSRSGATIRSATGSSASKATTISSARTTRGLKLRFPRSACRSSRDGLGTARGRIGYAFERGLLIPLPTLCYVTGGGVWARMETSNFIPTTGARASRKRKAIPAGPSATAASTRSAADGRSRAKRSTPRFGKQTNFASNTRSHLRNSISRPRSISGFRRIGLNYRFYSAARSSPATERRDRLNCRAPGASPGLLLCE